MAFEAIGGLSVRISGLITPMRFQDSDVSANIEGQPVPLAPINKWRQIYQVYRPEKAAFLEG